MPENITRKLNRTASAGFTLTELLIVIVIIGILLALLFPVFMKVRINAFQTSSISNLHEISEGLQRYQLDHDGASPPVLFGYAVNTAVGAPIPTLTGPVAPMGQAFANAREVPNESQLYFPGLYPTYVPNWQTFIDPENHAADTDLATNNPNFNVLCPNVDDACVGQPIGTLVVAKHTTNGGAQALPASFYALDSYDVSPQIAAPGSGASGGTLSNSTWVPRYQKSWTCLDTGNGACLTTAPVAPFTLDYNRQLRNPGRDGSTYVTADTYFVPLTGKVLVLYQDGNVRPIDASKFDNIGVGPDVSDISVPVGPVPDASASNFWKLRENE